MARTVVALYDTFEDANAAVRELVDNNFPRENISMMANDQSGEFSNQLNRSTTDPKLEEEVSNTAEGAGVGASIGATLGGIGGLLVGLGALTIPGIGPVIAAGPLATALAGLAGAGAGALAGGVTGGLIGALVDSGVPEETAQYYSEGVRRGGTLVSVNTDETLSGRAVNIMNRHNPIDINSRVNQWREQGWTGFGSDEPMGGMTDDHERTGTVRGVVDTGVEPTEERYGTEQNIPTTGDRDRTYGSAGVTGNPPSSTMTDPDYRDPGFGDRDRMGSDYTGSGYRDFSHYDTQFRSHFSAGMYGTTYDYDQFQPAYRYGYDLAVDPRYNNREWEDIEPEARRYWDEREPGAWERFKDSAREAWNRVKNSVS